MSGKIVVDAWLADLAFPRYMDELFRLGRRFEEAHPEYEIRIRGLGFRDGAAAVARAALEGSQPAIAEYYYTEMPNALDAVDSAGQPVFTSVENAVGGRTHILGEPVVLNDIVPALRSQYTWQGELVSLPTVATTFQLFTNVTMLRAAGVRDIPQTWQDLREASERVVKSPGGPPYAITWANNGIPFQHAVAVQGGALADHGNGRDGRAETVDFTTKEMMAWVSWWRGLHEDGLYRYTGELGDWFGTFELFVDQQVAFRLSSTNDIGAAAQDAANAGFEFAVSRFPFNAEVPYRGSVVAGTSLWLADGLDEATRDGALAFMQFLGNPRNAAQYHKEHSFIPITKSAFTRLEREGWFAEHPYHRGPSDQLDLAAGVSSAPGALIGDFFEIQVVLTRAMHDVLVRGADQRERFAQATTEAQEMLDRYLAEHPLPR
ncbi:extracellular solute-binding protein [Actinomadura alba]|uniref:Extracellular solute-binding protein n=1 Tax=Actinomadura alba TaxID=406431 RepID=A0ABR7LSQ1_9ACTN|nr:extracellular solute-binding protein [Actinomadura alba]